MEQEQIYFNILIETELYPLYKLLNEIKRISGLDKKKIIKEFIESNDGKGYDQWNNEEYVTGYLDKMIKKINDKNKDRDER